MLSIKHHFSGFRLFPVSAVLNWESDFLNLIYIYPARHCTGFDCKRVVSDIHIAVEISEQECGEENHESNIKNLVLRVHRANNMF